MHIPKLQKTKVSLCLHMSLSLDNRSLSSVSVCAFFRSAFNSPNARLGVTGDEAGKIPPPSIFLCKEHSIVSLKCSPFIYLFIFACHLCGFKSPSLLSGRATARSASSCPGTVPETPLNEALTYMAPPLYAHTSKPAAVSMGERSEGGAAFERLKVFSHGCLLCASHFLQIAISPYWFDSSS